MQLVPRVHHCVYSPPRIEMMAVSDMNRKSYKGLRGYINNIGHIRTSTSYGAF